MPKYFPLFTDIENCKILIIGSSGVALQRITKLLPFSSHITVVAPSISAHILNTDVRTVTATSEEIADMVRNGDFRIVINTDIFCADLIYSICTERNIPVNTVDDASHSTFIFPATVTKGPLTVAVSTSGASPAAAVKIRDDVEKLLPSNIEAILDWLSSVRNNLNKSPSLSPADRRTLYLRLTSLSFEMDRPLTDTELEALIASLCAE